MRKQISISLAFAILFAYSAIASVVFFNYGLPSLKGDIPQQLYSDSVTYEQIAETIERDDELVSMGGNFLGPVLVLRFFDFNRTLIHLFNLSLLFYSGFIAFRYLEVNRGIFLVGILSSPLLFFSTFGVNKEIFLLPLCICLLVYLQRRTMVWFAFSLFLAIFVRWQMVLFVLLVSLITSKIIPLQKRRGWVLIVLVGLLSIAYPTLVTEALESIEQVSIQGAQDEAGSQVSGAYPKMQEIQRAYGYFLVVIPKTLQLLFGFLNRFSVASIESDFWNNFVIMAQCMHNLILLCIAFIYRKIDLSGDCLFLICIFAVLFAVTPIFAPRYFYPVAVWLALWLALKRPLASTGRKIRLQST